MECKEKCDSIGCNSVVAAISIVAGVVVAILFAMGLVPVTLNFIKIALVMSVVAMAIMFGALFMANLIKENRKIRYCICSLIKCLLTGTIGTFLSATGAATAGLATTSIASIIFVGLTALFFVLMIIEIVSLILCLTDATCKREC